jgi:hypothetical protein
MSDPEISPTGRNDDTLKLVVDSLLKVEYWTGLMQHHNDGKTGGSNASHVNAPMAVKWLYWGYSIEWIMVNAKWDHFEIRKLNDNNVWAGIWSQKTFIGAQRFIDKMNKKEVR